MLYLTIEIKGLMKMNLKETKHLTTVEYGSGFQQLADSESDVDKMSLVLQLL